MIIISKNRKLKHENKDNRKLFYDSVPKLISKMPCGVTPKKLLAINNFYFTSN